MKDAVSISKLLALVSGMLSYLHSLGDPVKIKWSTYLDIEQTPQRYDVASPNPLALGVKSLDDDWLAVKNIQNPIHDIDKLVEVSNLLRSLGDYLPTLLGSSLPKTTRSGKPAAATTGVAQEVQKAWDMDLDTAYKSLGMASLGTRSISDTGKSMQMLERGILSDTLLDAGKQFFESLWNTMKDVVCTIYKDKTSIGDAKDKDLVTYIVGIVIALGKISNPLAALVITIAVKKGLDKLCAI